MPMNLIEIVLYKQAEMHDDLFNKKGKYFLEFDLYECLTYDLDSLKTFKENYGINPNKENLMKFAEKFKENNFIIPFAVPEGDPITRSYKVKENISSEKFSEWYLIEISGPHLRNYYDWKSGVVVPKSIADKCHTGLIHSQLSSSPVNFSIKKYKPIHEKMVECVI